MAGTRVAERTYATRVGRLPAITPGASVPLGTSQRGVLPRERDLRDKGHFVKA
jgi:hypothetical protein